MLIKKFVSDLSNDVIEVTINNNQKAKFKILLFDNVRENIKLFAKVNNFFKQKSINWVILDMIDNYILPANALTIVNKYKSNINCHIDDFEKFYFKNMEKFIKITNVYVPDVTKDDEWTVIIDKKKEKRNKAKRLKNDIRKIVGDWNSF